MDYEEHRQKCLDSLLEIAEGADATYATRIDAAKVLLEETRLDGREAGLLAGRIDALEASVKTILIRLS